ncbi:MAG: DUF4251 domain-containing protein [Phormidesmis sp. FL-bin-119]|nr:DUF4251 domain-containing protein [Pedobacter sp.]
MTISGSISAQIKSEKEARIQRLLESKNFTFVAESANPTSGGNIRLTSSNYQLRFYKDSLESFLPYFGTAFRARYGASQSPLIFSSSDFTYESKTSRKGSLILTIKINNPGDPDVLILSVSPLGYGTLLVNSIDRQSITFYGFIEPNTRNFL